MKAAVKAVHSPDVSDLMTFAPERPDTFGLLLQVFIGPEEADGEESFEFEICTPKWLEERYELHDVVVGRHLLIVREFDYNRIMASIERLVSHCSGSDWNEVALKLGRIGRWEFEDYDHGNMSV